MQKSHELLAGALLALSPIFASCEPDLGGTVRVYLDTDAPVRGGEALGFPPALFDRVRIDVFPLGSTEPCTSCSRVIALDHGPLVEGGLSFGVGVPTARGGTRIRATAYRSTGFPNGNPTVRGSLEVVVELPAIANGESRELTLMLPTDETGSPSSSLDSPRPISSGRPKGDRVGTWGPAKRVGCSGEPWPGQICVPGGAFFMPGVFSQLESLTTVSNLSPYDEQLVVLSPFFVDATETTVRSLLASGLLSDRDAVASWSGDEEGVELGGVYDWSTYSGNVERLDLPVTSVKPTFARSYCKTYGADLPTEAQIAYLIGGTRGTRYPWGNEEPRCSDAWVARVQFDFGTQSTQSLHLECAGTGFEAFRKVGTSGRDRVELETGAVEDVVGNAGELTRDRFTTFDAPCWGEGVVVDPTCDPADDPAARWVGRGGSIATPIANGAVERVSVPTDFQIVELSFRCARPGDDTTPSPTENNLVIGQGCRVDSDCGTGAGVCMGPKGKWPAGGIVGGYCTRKCSSKADCGPRGVCGLGYCFLGCDAENPPIQFADEPLLPTKCHGRRDLLCRKPDFAPKGACSGACTSDAECGGRYCDRFYGGCVDTKKPGAIDGTACTQDSQCKGVCVQGNSGGVCASACSAGGEIDSNDCGGADKGLCYASFGYESPGSLGYCYPACTKHSDCATPNVFCMPVPEAAPVYQEPPWWNIATSVCFEAFPCQTVGQSCGNGLICADTPSGPYCLEPAIPF